MPAATVIPDPVKILRRRGELGLTQEELAFRADLSKGSIENVEKGSSVRVSTLRSIADALDIEIADITLAESESEPRPVKYGDPLVELLIKDIKRYTSMEEAIAHTIRAAYQATENQEIRYIEVRMGSYRIVLQMAEDSVAKILELSEKGLLLYVGVVAAERLALSRGDLFAQQISRTENRNTETLLEELGQFLQGHQGTLRQSADLGRSLVDADDCVQAAMLEFLVQFRSDKPLTFRDERAILGYFRRLVKYQAMNMWRKENDKHQYPWKGEQSQDDNEL